jgi:Protein of unknown function (DUF1257)
LQTEYNDEECLVAALKEAGYANIEIHVEAQPLIGYHGDTRAEKAHIIIRRQHVGNASNDIGFVKGENGKYTAIISDFDKGKHNEKWLTGLKKAYVEKRIAKESKKRGLVLKSRKIVNGKLEIRYLKMGV